LYQIFRFDFPKRTEIFDRIRNIYGVDLPKEPPSLVGKALPTLKNFNLKLDAEQVEDKMILFCFWDMQQRPSRNCIMLLAKRAEQLKGKGVAIIAVHASNVDENTLNEWVEKNNIPFPVGMIQDDDEKTRFNWGIKSLPWLILTDSKQVVTAEGFGLDELDDKIGQADDGN